MKPCPFCAEEIQDAAIKCRHCGSMLDEGSLREAASARVGPTLAAPALAPAQTIFKGRPSWKGQFWSVVGAVLMCVGGLVLAPVLHLWLDVAWNPALIGAGVAFGLGLTWLLSSWASRATLGFHVTTRAIDVESGFLSKSVETLQLWKVRDIEFHQSLTDRLTGVARVKVFTHDVTTPQLLLWGLPGSRAIFGQLKDAIEITRQARNVIGVVD
jgi:hypothetical protein